MAPLNPRTCHERCFRDLPSSVADARHFVLGLLPDTDDDVRGAIAIMVSELATNAVVHARTDFCVRVEMGNEVVRVAVSDDSARAAQLRPAPTPEQVNGRGLRIVHEFADGWGVVPEGSGDGKAVWFTIKAPARVR